MSNSKCGRAVLSKHRETHAERQFQSSAAHTLVASSSIDRMGSKPSHHQHHHNHGKNGRKESKPAVFLDNNDPIFLPNFGMNQRPVMPEAVPPLAPPSNPPPSRPSTVSLPAQEDRPPLPPRRSESNLAPPVPRHSTSFPNVTRTPSASSSKSPPQCSPRPISKSRSHSGSVQCMHGNADHKMLIVENRFIAQTPGELSVEEGDLLYLIDQSNSEWWYVSNKSRQFKGHVPKSHVVFAEVREPWFAGNISSILAEQRVMQAGLPIGTFLIRENTKKGTLVLTVRSSNYEPPKAYTIYRQSNHNGFEMRDTNGHIIITFASLLQLVSHFSCERVPGEVQICTQLTQAAPPLEEPTEYVTMRKWQVNRKELKRIGTIGSGQFGEVYRAEWRNKDVAVKMLKTDGLDELGNSQFLDEAKTLTKLTHQNVICLLAVCATDQPFLIITEFMKNGSLLSWLHKLSKTLPSALLMSRETATKNVLIGASISAQVAHGMDYLAANQIVHRDLAARNVLVGEVSSNGVPLVKVADFGLARSMNKRNLNYVTKTDLPMPFKWTALEALENEVFDTRTDVWSYGVLLWEIGTLGQTPYKGLDLDGTMEFLQAGHVLPKPELVPDYVYEDVFKACLHLDPNRRPSFDRLFKYFDDINFNSLSATKAVSRH